MRAREKCVQCMIMSIINNMPILIIESSRHTLVFRRATSTDALALIRALLFRPGHPKKTAICLCLPRRRASLTGGKAPLMNIYIIIAARFFARKESLARALSAALFFRGRGREACKCPGKRLGRLSPSWISPAGVKKNATTHDVETSATSSSSRPAI